MGICDLVIGLTGPNASGKGEVAGLLVAQGFLYLSLSDVVREEALRRGLEPLRENLIRVGREMRGDGGAGAVAERVRKRIRPPCVVDSIRNPGEVEVLRSVRGFRLLGVDASPELRFRRLRRRGRPGDPETLEAFVAGERVEDSVDPEGQRSSATLALADRTLRNEGSLEELSAALDEVLRGWGTEEGSAPRAGH